MRLKLHPATLCLCLLVVVIILSWIFDAYGMSVYDSRTGDYLYVQSLLGLDGMRWGLRNVMSNMVCFTPLGEGVLMLFAIGLLVHSGLASLCTRSLVARYTKQYYTPFSRKERIALVAALLIAIIYVASLFVIVNFSRGALLSVIGTLQASPLIQGAIFLTSLGLALMGIGYGIAVGRYRRDVEIADGLLYFRHLLVLHLLVSFFASQLFACLEYSRLLIYIPTWMLYLPVLLTLWYYMTRKK